MSLSTGCKAYAIAVALGAATWWVLILSLRAVRDLFLWPGFPEATLIAFLPADILFFVLTPLVWAVRPKVSVWNVHRYATHYATLVTVTLCLISRGAWLGGALMVLASVGAECVGHPVHIPETPIEAKPSSVLHNILKTLAQTAIMWSIFLVLLPFSIALVDRAIGLTSVPAVNPWILWFLFWAAGSVGVYSGLLFATLGNGTPLPLDTATRFVVIGPYRVVRNPMAMLGIFQGVIVGFLLRSWLVAGYALAGAVLWHLLARPWEEADLVDRFGEDYVKYRKQIRNWLPTVKPYPRVLLTKVENTPQPRSVSARAIL